MFIPGKSVQYTSTKETGKFLTRNFESIPRKLDL